MHNARPRSSCSPAPADTDLPTNENAIDANAVTEEPAVSIKVDFHENMSSILEEIPDDGAEPDNANQNPAVSIEGSLAKDMSDTLGQILDVLKGSTIIEEHGKDDNSKFWAAYKKVSTEYDDDFLGRANDDMGIILTFAGLFSAVNSTFIVGMQPNPGDTTNALLLCLIQITVNGPDSVPDINTLSSSTGFSSSTVWVQTLAYASLAFSVLAAFGAVLGKQWLNSYKTARGRGSLKERGIERQTKLDGVEYFRMQTVLRTFLVLLQISLLLFGLSLSARMWAQQTTISSVIICTTAFGVVFYAGTMLVSVLRPVSPFQTPVSELFVAICRKILPDKFTFTPDIFGESSAIRWILETSTNPEIVEAAAAIVPRVQWPPNVDASAAFSRLYDIFEECQDREELYVMYGKAMAHLCIQSVEIDKELLVFVWDHKFNSIQTRFIRDAFVAGRDAYNQLKTSQGEAQPHIDGLHDLYDSTNIQAMEAVPTHQANARTALRTLVVHGQSNLLSRPNDEDLIWNGDLHWCHSDGREPSCEEFDWLVDYVVDAAEDDTDDETKGDALLALSAMHGLGSSTKRWSYISSLIHCMHSTRPHRVRHTALRAICEAREELASITSASMPPGVDAQLLNELSRALLTAVRPNNDQTTHDTGPDASFHLGRDSCYIRLICALTKNDELCRYLTHGGHLDRCISLIDGVYRQRDSMIGFYLLVIFGRIKSSGNDLPFSFTEEMCRLLIAHAWDCAQSFLKVYDDVDGIPAFVTITRLTLTVSDNYGGPRKWFADLTAKVDGALLNLQKRQARLVNDGMDQATVDAALSSMQDLWDDLRRMTEDQKPPQKDGGTLGY